MKRKLICWLAPLACLWGCSHPIDEQTFLTRLLESEQLADQNTLILYVAQGMCAECINRELILLNEHRDIAQHTIIVGNFTSKRNFLSSVASTEVKRKIFVPTAEMPEMKLASALQPHYILYFAANGTFGPPYYPTDCSGDRTVAYYQNLKPILSSRSDPNAANR